MRWHHRSTFNIDETFTRCWCKYLNLYICRESKLVILSTPFRSCNRKRSFDFVRFFVFSFFFLTVLFSLLAVFFIIYIIKIKHSNKKKKNTHKSVDYINRAAWLCWCILMYTDTTLPTHEHCHLSAQRKWQYFQWNFGTHCFWKEKRTSSAVAALRHKRKYFQLLNERQREEESSYCTCCYVMI